MEGVGLRVKNVGCRIESEELWAWVKGGSIRVELHMA